MDEEEPDEIAAAAAIVVTTGEVVVRKKGKAAEDVARRSQPTFDLEKAVADAEHEQCSAASAPYSTAPTPAPTPAPNTATIPMYLQYGKDISLIQRHLRRKVDGKEKHLVRSKAGGKQHCLLCRRKFESRSLLQMHLEESDMHSDNLKKGWSDNTVCMAQVECAQQRRDMDEEVHLMLDEIAAASAVAAATDDQL
jgi:hypothetical protein